MQRHKSISGELFEYHEHLSVDRYREFLTLVSTTQRRLLVRPYRATMLPMDPMKIDSLTRRDRCIINRFFIPAQAQNADLGYFITVRNSSVCYRGAALAFLSTYQRVRLATRYRRRGS